jgi:hypothetical protein
LQSAYAFFLSSWLTETNLGIYSFRSAMSVSSSQD